MARTPRAQNEVPIWNWKRCVRSAAMLFAVPLIYQKADTANNIAADRTQRFQFQIGTSF